MSENLVGSTDVSELLDARDCHGVRLGESNLGDELNIV